MRVHAQTILISEQNDGTKVTIHESTQLQVEQLYQSGTEHLQRMQWQDAESDFLKAIDLAPTIPNLYHSLGILYVQMNDHENAAMYFEEAVRLDPSNFKSIFSLAIAHSKRGDIQAAEKNYLQAIEIDRNSYLAHYYLAKLYYDHKKYRKCYDVISRAHELNETAELLMIKGIAAAFSDQTSVTIETITALRNLGEYEKARKVEYMNYKKKADDNNS